MLLLGTIILWSVGETKRAPDTMSVLWPIDEHMLHLLSLVTLRIPARNKSGNNSHFTFPVLASVYKDSACLQIRLFYITTESSIDCVTHNQDGTRRATYTARPPTAPKGLHSDLTERLVPIPPPPAKAKAHHELAP